MLGEKIITDKYNFLINSNNLKKKLGIINYNESNDDELPCDLPKRIKYFEVYNFCITFLFLKF